MGDRVYAGCDEKENSESCKAASDHTTSSAVNAAQDCHRYDEQVNVCLECSDADMSPLPRKYIRSVSIALAFTAQCYAECSYATVCCLSVCDV